MDRILTFFSAMLFANAPIASEGDISIESLTNNSHSVVEGVVLDKGSRWGDARHTIITTVTFQVTSYLLKPRFDEFSSGREKTQGIITVRHLGGLSPNNDVSMSMEGQPSFQVGARYVLFLRQDDGNMFYTSGYDSKKADYYVTWGDAGQLPILQERFVVHPQTGGYLGLDELYSIVKDIGSGNKDGHE